MLNMQNVKDIEITEGDVRTIHDKDNKLIWGRLAYDTKYDGDTEQQTYTGKNLFPYTLATLQSLNVGGEWSNNVYVWNGITYTINEDFTINVNGVTQEGAPSYLILNNSLSLTTGTEYVLNGCPSGGSSQLYSLRLYDGGSYTSETGSGLPFTYGSQNLLRINIFAGITVNNLVFKPMIRLATIADGSYEPYVGGIPSPNPDYPQDVNVVTGTQTVTISDGVDSEDYTISLGTIELCKIGDYQDYIYKSGDNWYMHKAIERVVLNGSEAWTATGGGNGYRIVRNNIVLTDTITLAPIVSNYFPVATFSDIYSARIDYGISNHNSNHWIVLRNKDWASASDVTTWLSSHNTTVYYALVTPTDTQITDTALIDQLDTIHQFLTRYGYNSNVTGNLPIIINQTSL